MMSLDLHGDQVCFVGSLLYSEWRFFFITLVWSIAANGWSEIYVPISDRPNGALNVVIAVLYSYEIDTSKS